VGVNEGEQSRKRSRRRRLLLTLTALAVLAGAAVGGAVLDRTVLDDEPAGITDAEHDRLIDACVAEDLARAGCTSWLAEIVEVAEAEGVGYRTLAETFGVMLGAYYTADGEFISSTGLVEAEMHRECESMDLTDELCEAFTGD
jgi:hypothetical protein